MDVSLFNNLILDSRQIYYFWVTIPRNYDGYPDKFCNWTFIYWDLQKEVVSSLGRSEIS